ncbi:hypothetical protein [Streptomyces fagopyri]|uniref:hypothetical protein n=1 Tax=Streptomyces fagopyri TaxID=2662397 RepID=UPI00371615A2
MTRDPDNEVSSEAGRIRTIAGITAAQASHDQSLNRGGVSSAPNTTSAAIPAGSTSASPSGSKDAFASDEARARAAPAGNTAR